MVTSEDKKRNLKTRKREKGNRKKRSPGDAPGMDGKTEPAAHPIKHSATLVARLSKPSFSQSNSYP
jgi:hypothetical protein